MALVPPAASAASAAIANPWRNCGYCPDKVFKTSSEFTRYLPLYLYGTLGRIACAFNQQTSARSSLQ